jgi:hypothetical protein
MMSAHEMYVSTINARKLRLKHMGAERQAQLVVLDHFPAVKCNLLILTVNRHNT